MRYHRVEILLLLLGLFPSSIAFGEERPGVLWPQGETLSLNAGFETGRDGRPVGWNVYRAARGMEWAWGATGLGGSKGLRFSSPPEGPAGPAGVNQAVANPPAGQTLEVTAWIRLEAFEGDLALWARCDGARGPEKREGAFENSHMAGYRPRGTTLWSPLSVKVTPGPRTEVLWVGLLVRGRGRVFVDEFRVRTRARGPAPGPKEASPGLFRAEGLYRATVLRPGESLRAWMPVPLLRPGQIPLTYRVWTEPEGRLETVVFRARSSGHCYAEMRLRPGKPGETFRLRWESCVLLLPHAPLPMPADLRLPFDSVPEEARPWTASTFCCDFDHPGVKALAERIRAQAGDSVRAVVRQTLVTLGEVFAGARGRVENLTASEALERRGSCTSNANLAAALLRAQGIPARILGGYPTWTGALQTHYVVEYWTPPTGWRVLESSRLLDDRPPAEQVEVALVLAEDETEDKASRRPGAAGGVPFLSLTEYPDATRDQEPAFFLCGAMPGKPGCDHRAAALASFRVEPAAQKEWIERLAARWTALARAAASGDKDPARGDLHADLSGVQDAAELAARLTKEE